MIPAISILNRNKTKLNELRGSVPLRTPLRNRNRNNGLLFMSILFGLVLLLSLMQPIFADPDGANITYNVSETKTPAAAQYLNTSGGSFTTVILNAETQNLKWKAYAGNVSGVLTLDDGGNYSIYQWQLTDYTGEVFASRNASVTWSNIRCANVTHVYYEETAMNHTTSSPDSINSTFSYKLHKAFYVGTAVIAQSSCKNTFTWVNNTAQTPDITSPFQEILLYDGSALVYTTFIDDNIQGFNFKKYDFQMIVPERGVQGYDNTKYYFYMELG
ncbi:MAG: hypothetical protein ABIJ34_07550 [archaeon]